VKQQVNPIATVVIVVVALAVLTFFGLRALNPPAPVERKPDATADKPLEMNGHPVPKGAPVYLMQGQARQGAGGNNPNGIAPTQMMGNGSGQMPQHP